jgi:hypothetical protein
MKSRKMGWPAVQYPSGAMTDANRTSAGMPEAKTHMHRYEDNIKMKRKKMGYNNADWIRVAGE